MVIGLILEIFLKNICFDFIGIWLIDIIVRWLVNISGNVWSYMVIFGVDYFV